jgi:quinoprotein glucose dehydrogenase
LGHDTWKNEAWKQAGGANNWGGMSLDEKRGMVFLALGSPAFDFYGGQRLGQNLFGNSVIALQAETGKRVWHFQTVHHDLWDYDLPCPPNLVTVNHGGRRVDAVAQVGKTGRLFLLDRETGKPLFPVEERAVPVSDLPGEETWPTQPFPLKPPPFARQAFGEDQVTDISPEAHAFVLGWWKKFKAGSIFVPPSTQGTVIFPGFHGGAHWGGASFDPTSGWLYVNSNELPWILTMVKAEHDEKYPFEHTGYHRFVDEEGYPAVKPPWGQLSAIDLNRGEIMWQVRLGEFRELTARGIPPTGTENFGGTIVTAGGLVFVAATKDEKFRAFDKTTGKLLWQTKLDAAGYATPSTYEVNGKQYVVIAAGGGGLIGTKPGDAFVVFALP